MTDQSKNFFLALDALSQRDYITARKLFELASKDKNFKEKSLYNLIFLDIRENKFESARNSLKKVGDLNERDFYALCSHLDSREYNFERSKTFIEKALFCEEFNYSTLLDLAWNYIKLGNYVIAEEILESLRFTPAFYNKATLYLISLKIVEGDYEKALYLLNKINTDSLKGGENIYYKKSKALILFKLDKLREGIIGPAGYMIKRLTEEDDDSLIEHLKEHLHPEVQRDVFYFFRYTDIKSLVDISKDKIKVLNPNKFEVHDSYLFKMDEPVGINNGELTNDICVKVFTGTDKIITMYPVKLSSEFDIEGMSKSEELSRKLKLGGVTNEKRKINI